MNLVLLSLQPVLVNQWFLFILLLRHLKKGKTVVYYTLELKDTVVGGRFDSALTKVPLNELLDQQELIMEMIKDVEGTLIIKEYPTKSASVQTIRGHVDRLIKKGH